MNWLATILIISGFILITNKSKAGFIVQGLGCLLYVVLNVDPAVTFNNLVFLGINVWGYYKWTYDGHAD